MAKPVYKHQEDNGELSIFTSGDMVLIACEHGHYWVIDAEQHSTQSMKSHVERSLSDDQAAAVLKAFR